MTSFKNPLRCYLCHRPRRSSDGDPVGTPVVRLNGTPADEPRRDIILEKCYRNSRPILVTAHALGFGIYRAPPKHGSTGLVQMFDDASLWEEIGYEVVSGELKEGSDVCSAAD